MTKPPISNLWLDLWADARTPDILWQIATLAICLACGWALARLIRSAVSGQQMHFRVMRLGVESFVRVLSPLLALMFMAIARPILGMWLHVNLLRVAMPLIASFAIIRLAFYVLRRIFARGGQAGSFLLLFEKAFATLVWMSVAFYITGLWPDIIQYLEDIVLPMGRSRVSLLTILQAIVSVAITLLLALWAGATLEERLMRLETVHSSLRAVMARMGRAILIVVAVLMSLSLVGIDLTVLSVFSGALGVGIGLGLQKLASSYVSGFVILLERSLSVGDIVTVDKYSGKVTQINTRYTVLRGSDGVESVVPNEMLVSGAVQNHSLTDKKVRLTTNVSVGYDTNVEQVLQLLVEVTRKVPRVLQSPLPQAMLIRFGADGLDLEIGFWIEDPENGRSNALSDVNRAILQLLQLHRITIPYPQREIRLIEKMEQ